MIKWNWRRKSDGEPLTRIAAIHTLDREQLANLLAAAVVPDTYDALREYSKAEMEREIRSKLATHADDMNWWRDNYSDDCDNEPSSDEVYEWARKQVAKL
jgi:hypothetical protein